MIEFMIVFNAGIVLYAITGYGLYYSIRQLIHEANK